MILDDSRAIIVRANDLRINTPPTRQDAANLWDLLRTARKEAEMHREEQCRPLKQAWDEAKKPFDTFIWECKNHEASLSLRMSEWDREQARLAQIEQAKIQARIDLQNLKIQAKAEAKGLEPVLRAASVIPPPSKTIETQAGTTQNRSERTVYGLKGVLTGERVDANQPFLQELLRSYPALFILDWVAFRKMADTGMLDAVAGVEKKIQYVYSQRK